MAERRMFSKAIVTSDAFLDMPPTARCLYFTLAMLADDDGFVNSPKSIMRQAGAGIDDLNILIAKRFILAFESGVVVIKHWRIHNYIQKDRYKETTYLDEKSQLALDGNKAYTEAASITREGCIQGVYTSETQVRLGEDSLELGQDRAGECSVGEAAATTTDAPDLQEVIDYAEAQGLRSVNCYRFYEYYSGCNWVTSKGKPIDWRLKLREWDHGDAQRPRQTSSNPFLNILNNSN